MGRCSISWYEQVGYDFGDAPHSFSTTLANDGPRHRISGKRGTLFLGNTVDGENDGRPSLLADQDDLNNTDDEDGVVLLATMLTANVNTQASLLAHSSATGKFDGWIDFNGNGIFDHPAEHLWQGASIQVATGNNVIPFEVPSGSIPGRTYARFRVSTSGGLTPKGRADDGEVEDYSFFIFQLSNTTAVEVLSVSNQTVISGAGGEIVVASGSQSLFHAPESGFSRLAVQGVEQGNVFVLDAIQEWRGHSSAQLNITGGSAVDHLSIEGANQELDLTQPQLYQFTSIESIDINGSGRNTLVLDSVAVAALQGTGASISVALGNDDELILRGNWRLDQPVMRDNRVIHKAFDGDTRFELTNGKPWTNPIRRADVTFDGLVSPADALLIINRLNSHEGGVLGMPSNDSLGWKYVDSTGDNYLSPSDALVVINYLNSRTANGEGEGTRSESKVDPFSGGMSPLGTLDEKRGLPVSDTYMHQCADWVAELIIPSSNVLSPSPVSTINESKRYENNILPEDAAEVDYLFGSLDELLNHVLL